MSAQRHEEAVSSVVGTVLMLGITVAVFAGFSVVALSYFEDQPEAPRSDLALVQEEGSMYLVHRGGESFSIQDGLLYINNGGVEETVPMSDSRITALGLGDDLDLGEQICLQGTASDCLYDETDDLLGAFLIGEGFLLLGAGDRADPNAYRDLTVELVSQSPSNAGQGDTVTWTVRVTNEGTASVPLGAVVGVQVDGIDVATATITQVLSPGESDTAASTPAWSAMEGTHALRLLADPSNAIAEGVEDNNEEVTAISIAAGQADPGEPFIDVNGDGLYTPGEDTQMTEEQITQVQSGSFTVTTGSLVLPPSVGDVSQPTISFSAPNGDIVVAVELSATTNPLTISAGGDIVFDSAELQTLNNNNDMTLTAGGSITGAGLLIEVDGALSITAGGALDLSGSSLTVAFGSRDITLQGASVDLTGATLSSVDQITVTATAGSIDATGVQATSSGAQTWKATGGGITLSSSTLAAGSGSLTACLASDTADGLVLSGTLAITDANNKLNAQRGSSCNQGSNSDTYVTPWPALATDSPRSKLE